MSTMPKSFGSAPFKNSVGSNCLFAMPARSPTVPEARDRPRIGRSGERNPPALSLPDGAPAPNLSCGSGMRSSLFFSSRCNSSSGIAAQISPVLLGLANPPER